MLNTFPKFLIQIKRSLKSPLLYRLKILPILLSILSGMQLMRYRGFVAFNDNRESLYQTIFKYAIIK